ncbi:hypothetical protein [Pajaroellobacter abortibovis]|nr:hypothetical protein [Pajaroellobacter abortibovis]
MLTGEGLRGTQLNDFMKFSIPFMFDVGYRISNHFYFGILIYYDATSVSIIIFYRTHGSIHGSELEPDSASMRQAFTTTA